ncbi:hypothetical protein BM531_21725, partial [Clostridioides difficile]
MPWIASAMGADGQLLTDSILYGCVVIIAIPAYILQCEFQCLFATAEKPKTWIICCNYGWNYKYCFRRIIY